MGILGAIGTFLTVLLVLVGIASAVFICIALVGGVIALFVNLFYVIMDIFDLW